MSYSCDNENTRLLHEGQKRNLRYLIEGKTFNLFILRLDNLLIFKIWELFYENSIILRQ